MTNDISIKIDSRLKYNYFSYYLLGILNVYGKECIEYDIKPFMGLHYRSMQDYNSGVPFIYSNSVKDYKIFICFEDNARVYEDRYEWCDIYAMVNPTEEQVKDYNKLFPIGPEFGITIGSSLHSIITCARMYLNGRKYSSISPKIYLRDYLYTNIRRRPIEDYERKCEVRKNYIFHASTLWYNEFAATYTNMYRGEFLKACRNAKITIEGGLFYVNGQDVIDEMPDYPKYKEIYKDFIYEDRLSMDDYIKKTKASVVVFNTPSVCGCHGWKLCEYLCMGKAIISSPLSRVLPGEGLIHGENVHFVQTPEDIYDAVVRIINNDDYRRKLERGARAYFEKYLAPEIVIKRIIDRVCL